jgi:hypothetical protein
MTVAPEIETPAHRDRSAADADQTVVRGPVRTLDGG